MDIYENFVIGNFLYGLGAEMARRHIGRDMPGTLIALLQQMKLDRCYGDVIVKNPGIFRLLEFKREERRGKDAKEQSKLLMLKTGMNSISFTTADREELRTISRQIHWYVETPEDKSMVETILVVPYLDHEELGERSGRITLADFVRDVANEASTNRKTEEEMKSFEWYLTLLCTCRGSDSAALLVLITADGELKYEPLPDIRDFVRPRSQIIQRMRERTNELSREYDIRIAKSHERFLGHVQQLRISKERGHREEHTLNLEYGYGMGM